MVVTTLVLMLGLVSQFSAPLAKTELIASTTAIEPGKPFSVAVKMTMAPGWHSYYSNPGESGQATGIVWHLPPGFKAGSIRWPAPTRIVVGGVAGYVYENEVWLVTDITPPGTSVLGPEQTVKINADVSWLLCREACVPQKSKLTISLVVRPTSPPNSAFAPALAGLPKTSPNLSLTATVNKKQAVLAVAQTVPSTQGVKFFPADATYFGADLATIQSTGTGIRLVVPLSKYAPGAPKRLTGLLVVPSGAAKGVHWIDVKVTER